MFLNNDHFKGMLPDNIADVYLRGKDLIHFIMPVFLIIICLLVTLRDSISNTFPTVIG